MSWSVSLIGYPENVVRALDEEGEKLRDVSREEFDAAKPALAALVRENFAKEGSGYVAPVVRLDASGSGYSRDGEHLSRSVTVKLEPSYSRLV